jgi:protein-tyrosine phosphatase
VVLAAKRGIELRTHKSRKVAETDLEWADLIVIMDGRNRLMLHEMSTTVDKKVVWIGAWLTGIRPDAVDPYGQTLEKQRLIIERLDQATKNLAEYIQSPND